MAETAMQFGMKVESTYGTEVVVDRFYELHGNGGESLRAPRGRTRSAGYRSGQVANRTDRFLPFKDLVSGTTRLDVPTKGYGVLLNAITGGTAGVAAPSDSNYVQTHTKGSLIGKSYTLQKCVPDIGGTNRVFTYFGCKVARATWSIDPDGVLVCEVEWMGADHDVDTSLASVSYSSDFRVFSFINATMDLASTTTPVTNWSLTLDNVLSPRRMIQGTAVTLEPVAAPVRPVTLEWEAEFTSLTDYNRAVSNTAAGALAAMNMTCNGDVAHGGTTLPQIKFATPNVDIVDVDGPYMTDDGKPMARFTGEALFDGTNADLTVTYRTTDSAI